MSRDAHDGFGVVDERSCRLASVVASVVADRDLGDDHKDVK